MLALDVGVRQTALVLLAALVARARRLHAEDAVDVGALGVEVRARARVRVWVRWRASLQLHGGSGRRA